MGHLRTSLKGFFLLSALTTSLSSPTNERTPNPPDLAKKAKVRGAVSRGESASRQLTGNCCFKGQCREAGQWLQGPTHTCMCERFGSGKWIGCQPNNKEESGRSAPEEASLTALRRRQAFANSEFVFDLQGSLPGAITGGGTIQGVDRGNLPSLEGEGVAYTLFNIEPCGINLPHVHPRATELIYVISGQDLRTAFVEENGGRVITNDIDQGHVTFFPRGLIHYQQNLSCESATYISALNSDDPGVSTISTQFFSLPEEGVRSSLGEGQDVVDALISGLPSGPAEGREACMKKCGLWEW